MWTRRGHACPPSALPSALARLTEDGCEGSTSLLLPLPPVPCLTLPLPVPCFLFPAPLPQVVSIYEDFLGLRVSAAGVSCIKQNLLANTLLRKRQVDAAIACYDEALAIGFAPLQGLALTKRSQA